MEFCWLSRWVHRISEFVRPLTRIIHEISGLGKRDLLSRPCQVLGFKTVALIADRLSFSLHHYSMHAGKTGGYIPTHGLEILAYWVVPAIYGFFVVSHDVLH